MSDTHMKRCSTSLITREMQIRGCHYTPHEMAKIKKQNADKPSAGKNELKILYTASENTKWYITLGCW